MPLVLFVGHPCSGKTTRAMQLASHIHQLLFPPPAPTPSQEQKQPSEPSPSPSFPAASPPELKDGGSSDPWAALSALTLNSPPPSAAPATTASPPSTAFVKGKRSQPSTTSSSSPSKPALVEVVVVNHESLLLSRAAMYGSSQGEKAGRSAFRAAVERSLTSSRVVLVDYLNHIKGYRYELWCRAREMGTTYAVVYVDTPAVQCKEWNQQRPASERYSEAAMTDLLQRMEVPNSSKRWDEPLFTVKHDEPLPAQQIAEWLLHGKQQVPGLATLSAGVADSSYLQRLELCLSSVCSELVRLQASGLVHVGDEVQLPGSKVRLLLVRKVYVGELKRVQTQFVKMNTLRPMQGEEQMATSFVTHLQNALDY